MQIVKHRSLVDGIDHWLLNTRRVVRQQRRTPVLDSRVGNQPRVSTLSRNL